MAEFQTYSERRFRAGIAAPDGVYFGEDFIDDDGISADPGCGCAQRVTISGDRIEVDYDGTDPQVRTLLNAPLAATMSATVSCVKAC